MSDGPDPERLKELEERLQKAQAIQTDTGHKHVGHTQAGAAWRMIIELVTGMGVGVGIGYGLDYVFGTLPLFLVIFSLLGFAAGIRVMMQTAHAIQNEQSQREQGRDETHGG